MADPKGFIKIKERYIGENRPVHQRVNDFDDVHQTEKIQELKNVLTSQSSRCMDCGVPFCHFSCPLGNLIPEFNDLAYKGDFKGAYEKLSSTNNFPEFTGRLCPALCESGCVLGSFNPAITIENIEKLISDVAFKFEYVMPQLPVSSTHKTVAIIGSGPAGLAAAQQLARVGHTVVVYEKDDKVGGLLRYGIPNFKLEKNLIDRRINLLEQEGVRFSTGIKVGGDGKNDVSLEYINQIYDATIITTGTEIPNDLPIEGRELNGVHFALPYLKGATKKLFDSSESDINAELNYISAEGKNVLIVGGGDTGSDCLGTALRQGANFVTTLQVLPKPPQNRSESQPWPTYPNIERISSSIEEGDVLKKSQFLYETTVTKFIGDSNGNVTGAILQNVEFKDGKFAPIEGTEREIPVDLVLISIGFKSPETKTLFGDLNINLTNRGLIDRNKNFMTNIDGIFCAGDSARGQSLIVWAIAEGRSVAASVDEYLMGTTSLQAPIKVNSASLK